MNTSLVLFFSILYSLFTLTAQATDSHDHREEANHTKEASHKEPHEHEHGEHEHEEHEHEHEEDVAEISESIAQLTGVVVAVAGPHTLRQTSTNYGRLTSAPEHTSHVIARFPGIVRSVAVNIGDQVVTGDLLAVVESNESLKRYEVRAPINGTIIQRHANAGEMTQEQVLFSLTSFESLWAELRIFPTQQQALNIAQPVRITAGEKHFDTHISHLLPAADASPYLIARAKITDPKHGLYPGLMVEGAILINELSVPLAVEKQALQTLGGRIGVFVKEQNDYRFTELVLGRSDAEFSEVLSGLEVNSEYVTENSYLIKADIEKSEAEHEH